MTTKLLFILFLTSVFVSCNKATPASFWKSYQNQHLVQNISDQGPYGGHRALHWKSKERNTFTSEDILHFATKNGWTLVDSALISSEQTNRWVYSNEAIFPLTNTGFSDTVLNDSRLGDFPRWFAGEIDLYKFETGWVLIKPGTDSSTEENGFVILNHDKTEFAVYHLWGE